MPLTQTQIDAISLLKRANNVLILPSTPVDGDSIGSALSLYLVLKKLGKQVTVVAEEKVPVNYNFLPEIRAISHELHFVRDFIVTIDCRDLPPANVRHEIQGNKVNIIVTPQKGAISRDQVSFANGPAPYDLIITVDTADPSQLGKIYEEFTELFHLAPVVNIDHHASNKEFGKINLVDIMAASTTMVVLPIILELGQNLMDADVATLLLAGLITDTGSFQNPNTTPDAFSVAAKLIDYGARQQEIIRNVYKTKKLSTLRLWGRTLTKLQHDDKYRLVWSTLDDKDFGELGGKPDDVEGVLDELMINAPDADIVFLLKEKSAQNEIGGSIRTLASTIDASKIAMLFNGGGHMQAAGFRIYGKSMSEAEKQVVEALREFQKKRLGFFEQQTMPQVPVMQEAPLMQQPQPSLAPSPATPAPLLSIMQQPPAAPAPPLPALQPTPAMPTLLMQAPLSTPQIMQPQQQSVQQQAAPSTPPPAFPDFPKLWESPSE